MLETGHKPLIAFIEKPLTTSSHRIQCMLRYSCSASSFNSSASLATARLNLQDSICCWYPQLSSICYLVHGQRHSYEEQVFFFLHYIFPVNDARVRYSTRSESTLQLVKSPTLADGQNTNISVRFQKKTLYCAVLYSIAEVEGLLVWNDRFIVSMCLRWKGLDGVYSLQFSKNQGRVAGQVFLLLARLRDSNNKIVSSCNVC